MRLRERLAPRFVNFVLLAGVLFSVIGCASVSVESQRADATIRLRRKPQVLIVKDLAFRAKRKCEQTAAEKNYSRLNKGFKFHCASSLYARWADMASQ
jgi:hypothetical protein